MADETLNLFAFHANKRFESVLRFLRFTGCRLGELCAAKWADIDLERGEWTIHRHKSRKFTRKPKRVALASQAVELLRNELLTRAFSPALVRPVTDATAANVVVTTPVVTAVETSFVFINNHGRRWTPGTLGTCFRWLKQRHKIDTNASLHGIRHAAASAMLGAGAPIKLVAEQLGHSRCDILEDVYYHRSDSHLAAMRAAVEMGLPRES